MSDALDTVLEAVSMMHPITKSWLIHGPVVTHALSLIDMKTSTRISVSASRMGVMCGASC